jgi:alkanesulfonate monooxygenase SsuD/methylene tetrahydromethanopterin reductase-like flavin-dependent oxidoreductase (luciferase family)
MMDSDFRTRGARTDEALDLMRRLWTEEWVESEGPHYPTPPVTMRPLPPGPIPIVVGGLSEVALRRAARCDGWVGDIYTTEQAAGFAARLRELRPEDAPAPQVIVALNDAFLPEHFAAAAERGITEVITQPWFFYHGPDATLEQKIESLHRFKADVLDPLRGKA